ncbi:23S rRNA (guanosine-2'-O-)-methyltransferase RlmB [bacterium HR30]|nr:23S rRNA (guanosine-2'-O-)-methyltransferase RlmB [bacterium HR30]
MASPQENRCVGTPQWLYPGHALNAWLESDSSRILELEILSSKRQKHAALLDQAHAKGVRVRFVEGKQRSSDTEFLQSGCRAKLAPFPYKDLASVVEPTGPGLLVVLDHVLDPRNLGAVARNVLAAGGRGLIIPKDRAAPVTPVVEVAAAGACAHLNICRVVNLARALEEIQAAGYWTIALDTHAAKSLFTGSLPPRLALVAGGEQGLSRLVRERSDESRVIPIDRRVESLNVAVALGIACFWWAKDHALTLTP